MQPHLPTPFGRAASPLEQVVISQEIARAGIQMPQLLMGTWAVGAVVAHGSARQKRELAVPTLRGEVVWCQLFSEPGAGSDLASLSTRAEGRRRMEGQRTEDLDDGRLSGTPVFDSCSTSVTRL